MTSSISAGTYGLHNLPARRRVAAAAVVVWHHVFKLAPFAAMFDCALRDWSLNFLCLLVAVAWVHLLQATNEMHLPDPGRFVVRHGDEKIQIASVPPNDRKIISHDLNRLICVDIAKILWWASTSVKQRCWNGLSSRSAKACLWKLKVLMSLPCLTSFDKDF